MNQFEIMVKTLELQNPLLPKTWASKGLESFEPTPEAHKLVELLRNRNVEDSIGLWISGQAGCGKTHLLLGLMKQIAWEYFWTNRKLDNQIKFYNYTDLCSMLRQDPNNFNLLKTIRTPRWLFIDDLGTSKSSDFIQEKIYSIFNYRCENELPTFVTTNLGHVEIAAEFTERMTSRIKETSIWVELKNTKDYRSNNFKENMKKYQAIQPVQNKENE